MYHALLPEKSVKLLKREYHLRLFIVLSFFVSIGIAAGLACLFPSYIFSTLNEQAALVQKAAEERSSASTTASLSQELASAGALVSAISSATDPADLSEAAERAAGLRSPGISITSIDVRRTGPSSAALSVGGRATARDDLVAFEKSLEGDASFSGVTVPISDLAKGSDIQFSLQMSASLP